MFQLFPDVLFTPPNIQVVVDTNPPWFPPKCRTAGGPWIITLAALVQISYNNRLNTLHLGDHMLDSDKDNDDDDALDFILLVMAVALKKCCSVFIINDMSFFFRHCCCDRFKRGWEEIFFMKWIICCLCWYCTQQCWHRRTHPWLVGLEVNV